jgi:hypothetical protein
MAEKKLDGKQEEHVLRNLSSDIENIEIRSSFPPHFTSKDSNQ